MGKQKFWKYKRRRAEMMEEFDLLEGKEIPFCNTGYMVPAWYTVENSESLFCRKKPKSELTVVIREEGYMYFLSANMREFAELCRIHEWYIVSHQPFSERMEIGLCLMEAGKHSGWYSLGRSRERNAMFRDVLNFTFEKGKRPDFYPYETAFKGETIVNGCKCYYLHDYYPTRIKNTDEHQKRVSNLIFRFKEGGYCGELVAQILTLCLKHAGFSGNRKDTVLIPIPASTRERQRKRFPVVCHYLSKWLGIMDGFRVVWIAEDREQMKGKGTDKDVLANLRFTRRHVRNKHVVLLDDILTTGESFRQIQRRLEKLGAVSVIGVFLGKTVDHLTG